MATSELCSCFGQLQPKYKRKVNQIFPRDPKDGLVKSNMDKLIFYALSSPEKLDRIGAYLARKLERYIYWKRYDFVVITMDAMEQLMSACHAPDINLFVESFLKMVQALLESTETNLQIRGTESFVIFANIEEDTPSYHREYDFFVSKFSEMCYKNGSNSEENKKVRMAGLSGLQGIFRKTASDDLQVNIWDKAFMGKIIPSLLHVLEQGGDTSITQQEEPVDSEDEPWNFSESILREIIGRASFGNVHSVIEPVLLHLDSANLWVPSEFAIRCFRIIMFSVQNQYSYLVIQMLLSHLDKHVKSSVEIKTIIVEVISTSVAIASGGSMGASVIEVFNTLLHHLRLSVDARSRGVDNVKYLEEFEQAIIRTIGIFAQVLPDYQKSEIMMFIMGKLPSGPGNLIRKPSYQRTQSVEEDHPEILQYETLKAMYLLCLLKVAIVYKSDELSTTFPETLLDSLLKVSISSSSQVRKLAHEIFHALIDRQNNLPKLTVENALKSMEETGITMKKSSKADIVFFQKHKDKLFWHIYQSASHVSNKPENIFVIYQSLVLLCIEVNDTSVLIELIRFVLSLQLVYGERTLNRSKAAIHALVCAFLSFIADVTGIDQLNRHIKTCIKLRQHYKYLLPMLAFSDKEVSFSQAEPPDDVLFSLENISKALHDGGFDTMMLTSPYVPQPLSEVMVSGQQDDKSYPLRSETESISSTGGAQLIIAEEITFDTLKDVLCASNVEPVEGSMNIYKANFHDIAATADGRAHEFNQKIDAVLEESEHFIGTNRIKETHSISSLPGEENYEMSFSDQYVY